MKRILVPKDFSINSKKGIPWATPLKSELIFIHILYKLRPTQWTDEYFAKYSALEEKNAKIKRLFKLYQLYLLPVKFSGYSWIPMS